MRPAPNSMLRALRGNLLEFGISLVMVITYGVVVRHYERRRWQADTLRQLQNLERIYETIGSTTEAGFRSYNAQLRGEIVNLENEVLMLRETLYAVSTLRIDNERLRYVVSALNE